MVHYRSMILLSMGLLACSRQEPARDFTASSVLGQRPEVIASAVLQPKGAICPIERVNGELVRSIPVLKAGQIATVAGWITIADEKNPTPALIHLVLRPSGSKGDADAFIAGKRETRRDPSSTDKRMLNSGYIATGRLPTIPGTYEVFVWTGDGDVQVACNTQQRLELQ